MDLPPKSPAPKRPASVLLNAPGRREPDDLSGHMRSMSLSQDRRASTSTPRTPTAPNAPLTPNSARRPSSSFALRQSASSPRLTKRPSRSSLSGQSPQAPQDGFDKQATPKRSISNLISGLREAQAQSNMASIAEPVQLTAPDIAKVHFARELARLETADSETMVVLHDSCYGHRFSRPRTSKSSLSMIVERPERLHAGVLGAAAAFVRMGGHHEGQTNAPTVEREVQDTPPFKIRRTTRTLDVQSGYVTNVHGTAWMRELRGMCDSAGTRLANLEKELARDSTTEEGEKRTLHEGDLYLCAESLNAFQGAMGGVADAVDAVFSPGVRTKRAFAAVRPPGHHCSADYPSGFCWLNNVHVGLEYAAQAHGLTHAAIIDFDLHHGDGSQSITWDRNSKNNIKRISAKPNSKLKLGPDIGYYSLHDINSYPCESGDDEKVQAASLCIENAHGQSIWNVHLQTWKTEDEFWDLYETRYKVLLDKARAFLRHHTARLQAEGKVQAKSAIFISAGFDASEWEGEGMQRHKVNVPTEFYARFTRDMVQLAQEEGTGCDGRVISVLEGGYSDRALCSGVLSHLSGLSLSSTSSKSASPNDDSLGLEQHMLNLSLQNGNKSSPYDTQWWSPENLTALEMKVNPPAPAAQNKKYRTGPQPTYATPTESFAYKVHDPERFARAVSGTMRESTTGYVRPPTPPVPEIDWVIATQELTKMLIPQDRQTKSCTPEQLAGPKKVAVAPTAAERDQAERPRQLRTRAKPSYREPADEMSRSDRRRTTSDLPEPTEPVPVTAPAPARRSSRRSSMASTLSSAPTESSDTIPPVPPITNTTNTMPPPLVPTGPSGEVPVKKTRAPPKLRKMAAPASAPVSPMATFKHQPPPLSTAAQLPVAASSAAPGAGAESPTSGMDALTKGLKKVTLKVGTREEHDKKMKEKLDADRRARALKGAETRRVNKAAREAKVAEPKITPAQRAKLGPEASRTEGSKPVPAVQEAVQAATPAVPQQQPEPSFSHPLSTVEQADTLIDPLAAQRPTVFDTPTESTIPPPVAPTAPQFEAPVYTAPPVPTVPATAPAPPAAPVPAPPQEFAPLPEPASAPIPTPTIPQQSTSPLPSPIPANLEPTRKPSYSSLYRFVPVIDKTPPNSRPPTSARAMSYPNSPQGSNKPSPPDRAASSRDVAERPLPVFSATGHIPFAQSGAQQETSGLVQGQGSQQVAGGSEQGFAAGAEVPEAAVGSGQAGQQRDGTSSSASGGIWEVPETPGQ